MSEISLTGRGLSVIISCEYSLPHNWMTFASWYSIQKNLPDAQVGISCKRTDCAGDIFNWPTKCKVPYSQYSKEFKAPDNVKIITPDVMAVDTYKEEMLGPTNAKDGKNSTFVSYLEGCGDFVLTNWIHTSRSPFSMTGRFFSDNLTVNEYRILKLWEMCHGIYAVTT